MSYENALSAAVDAALAAGALLRAEFHRAGGPRGSGSHADADREAEEEIRRRLLAACPWGYLGEETGPASGTDTTGHVWLVDPNDGTSTFLRGYRGSSVSIGAVRAGVPVLGVVYAFGYPDDGGDLLAWAEGCGPIRRNGRALEPAPAGAAARLAGGTVVLVSQHADRNPEANARCVAPGRHRALPSIAYRLALVAAGEAVAAVSLNGPGAWDYGAGHALVAAAGGILLDEAGQEVRYAANGASQTRFCFGGAAAAVRALAGRPWAEVLGRAGPAAAASPPRFPQAPRAPGRAVADAGRLARAQGCLLGQLAGDALGALVEFEGENAIAAAFPQGVRDLVDGGHYHTLAGQPTDDSELALMLARSLVELGRFEVGAVREAYRHWLRSRPFDCGHTTFRGLTGTPDRGSKANGSLMRVSPLGIFAAGRATEAAAWAREDSSLTHPNPTCREACAAYVAAIATAVAGGDARAACDAAAAEAARGGVAEVADALAAAAAGPPRDFHRQSGFVLIALQNAFHRLLHAPSLEEGVIATVAALGDTDTNAAIAGALLGAVHGRAGVPARWRAALLTCRPLAATGASHPRSMEFWPVDALELAEALLVAGGGAARIRKGND